MEIQGKNWGTTALIHRGNNVEVHYIEIEKGGFCSEHIHQHKFNKFTVLEGELEVKIWKSEKAIDRIVLKQGHELTVAPGEFHQFAAVTFVRAIETYWVELEKDDIVRRTQGGKNG